MDEGEDPPILLLHGNPTWSFLYRDVIKRLRDGFRCIALDYPGFGLSTARPDYRFTPAEHAELPKFERLFSNHRAVLLSRARHYVPHDEPDELVAAFRRWWGESGPEAATG